MWLTPVQTAASVLLVLASVVVTHINATGPKAARLRSKQAAIAHHIAHERRGFEKDHHLVVTPPAGTPVVLVADEPYLREYHGAVAGQLGTVIEPSSLNPEDSGVLVDWGVRSNDMVRMDLSELRLAPHA